MASRNSKRTKRNGIFFAIWFLLLLILVIVFFVKKDDFIANLKQTNFFERVVGSTPEFIQNYEAKNEEQKSNGLLDVDVAPAPGAAETQQPGTYDLNDLKENSSQFSKEQVGAEAEEDEKQPEPDADSEKENPPKPAQEKPAAAVPMTNVKLFFVTVDADGNVNRKSVTRQIPKSDSPLTNTLRALLQGPLDSEKAMSLIPERTRVLGVTVRNGIAAINLSEEFEYNAVGVDGYRAQLMQIVYTATEFATVESVQFLIEGQHKDYIGSGEDIWMWIGSPYTRSSFN